MNRTAYYAARRAYRAARHADTLADARERALDVYRDGPRQVFVDTNLTAAGRVLASLPDAVCAAITARPVTLGRIRCERRLPANRKYAGHNMELSKRLALRRTFRAMYGRADRFAAEYAFVPWGA